MVLDYDSKISLEEILNDTIEYYRQDPKRRCVTLSGACVYSGKSARKDTEGCAVGRLLDPQLAIEIDSIGTVPIKTIFTTWNNNLYEDHIYKEISNKIPLLIKNNLNFFVDLQSLHDLRAFWDYDTFDLSESGKAHVEMMKTQYINK